MSPSKIHKTQGTRNLSSNGKQMQNKPNFGNLNKSNNMWSSKTNSKVLGERNQEIMPVAVWVESGDDFQCPEDPVVRAALTEEQQVLKRREKEERLRRFQDEVRNRVLQHAQIYKSQQLKNCYEMVKNEGRILEQTSNAAQRLMLRNNLFPTSPERELVKCSRNSDCLSKAMKQIRHRLAACQIVQDEEGITDIPMGLWKLSPPRNAKSIKELEQKRFFLRGQDKVNEDEQEEEEDGVEEEVEEGQIPLIGQHDCPLDLECTQFLEGCCLKTVKLTQVDERLFKVPYTTSPPTRCTTDVRSAQYLWIKNDQEGLKKQRQSQFLKFRRLFMDIEREQAKDHRQHRKHLKRIARIKLDKEQQRLEEERNIKRLKKLERDRMERAKKESVLVNWLKQEEEERAEERGKKEKESKRYIKALRAQIKEKYLQDKIKLPPLCCCGDNFWDSHPDTCANNCVFYNNPKVYIEALRSALLSCGLEEKNLSQRVSARRIASMQLHSPRSKT